ncbi:sensor histidine kinase [Streptomyces sp. NPDC000405]|uniref:sensor histidine kinase n=1 Tax=Streptomyces sp. NPDC000405 TaxID=3161033 RepID=UPI00398D32E1
MNATSWARELSGRLTDPGLWSRRRLVGECLLAAAFALLAGVAEGGHGWPRMAAVAVVAAVLSLTRRALPITALLATSALSGGTEGGASLLLMAVGWSAGHRIAGVLRASTSFGAAFALYLTLSLWQAELSPAGTVTLATVFFVVTAVFPGLAGRYWTQRRTLLDTLRLRNAQLLREREMIAGQARMRERQRIAQDMHDSLGHQLALIAVQTGALEVDRELTGRQREAVGVLREASVAAMRELREVVGILKDGVPEDERPGSRVVAGIEGLVESAVSAGMKVTLERSGEPRPLAPATDHAGYRVVQEGLTNAAKHAPGAAITVGVRHEPDALVVEVANGPAAPTAAAEPRADTVSGGEGLTGLRERARLVGGMVFTGPGAAGAGFRLAAVLPYDAAEARESRGSATGATFVDPAEDFRRQPRAGAPGEGGAVIDRLDPREEFKDIMGTKKSNGCLLGCGIALLLLVALVVAAVFTMGKVIDQVDKGMIDPSTYASVKVGDSERDVREKLPSGKSFLTSDAKDKIPAAPAGTSCLTLLSTDDSRGLSVDTVYRFCFKDGRLSDKREFHVKS